jgi:tRNA(Ile2) C34 agmatinyltransferase TiaS
MEKLNIENRLINLKKKRKNEKRDMNSNKRSGLRCKKCKSK